ncbi:hypothetical protein DyAD56_02070 [Dyella sp. AD56]|uniref:hypothetical protein n=1 Tax=Dyella sp. AD56 TaxID=1528744 RepID=UPI000CC27890|nr:hypothetical protein [Dyella sp. AD56]PMQ07532.1 hypothetical protein DyAD56_02070 [Dyella sp. AD56]
MARLGQVRHRQEGDSARGLALLDSETRETLGRRRWRQPPLTRAALALALSLVLVLHVLFVLALWYEMKPKPLQLAVTKTDIGQALIVRLIDHRSEPRPAQAPEPPELPAPPQKSAPPRQVLAPRVSPVTQEKPRRDAMVVQDHGASPAPATSVATPSAVSLFGKDGSIRLPSATGTTPATASTDTGQAKPADDRQIMQHDSNRMHYKATRFEKYFPPPNETAGGAVGRHIGDAIKDIVKSTCDPTKRSTATNLLCGVPPVPPSPMNKDERLNLPPHPLADNPNPPTVPPLSSCIAEYKDGKPLSYGCPIDTPDLAFKAEMRECIDLYRAGKRLKTWCPLDTPKRAAEESPQPADSSSVGAH